MKNPCLFLFSLLGFCLLAACGGNGSTGTHAGPATHFSVSAPATATAGTAISFGVTALDASNNTVTTYSGTMHFTSSDLQAVLPANSKLTLGVGTFSATLKTSGGQTVTATDTVSSLITGSSPPISVSGPATHFSVSAPGGDAAFIRSWIPFTIIAFDASNNLSTGFTGTVRVTSSDSEAILPPNVLIQGGEGGFQLAFETAGNQTVTAIDTAMPSITGTSSPISVTSASTLTITSGPPPNGTVGTSYDLHTIRTCIQFILDPFPVCVEYGLKEVSYFPLSATGGVVGQGYTWNWAPVAGSSLPLGLNLANGRISGTPTVAGTYQVSVTVTDSGSPAVQMSANYTIIIANTPPPSISVDPAPSGGALNLTYRFTFSATAGFPPYQKWSKTGALPPGLVFNDEGVLSGTPTQTGLFPIAVTVQDSTGESSAPQNFTIQVYAHGFAPTGSMGAARLLHTATLLSGGKVLIAGGQKDINAMFASAELYDPTAGTFALTASMAIARACHTATLLNNGTVLVIGGGSDTAELYDPTKASFSATGSMETVRTCHTATLLANGEVLVTGGTDASGNVLATAEVYDPTKGTFSPANSVMEAPRANHTATLLNTGMVLVAGGANSTGALSSAELFDPVTASFSSTDPMATAAFFHTATFFKNTGNVMVAGGDDTATAELFKAASFSATGPMQTVRAEYTATLLTDGTVLVAGGQDPTGLDIALAELYDPNAGIFTGTGSLGTARSNHTATLLNNGLVLVTGGVGPTGVALATAELYR